MVRVRNLREGDIAKPFKGGFIFSSVTGELGIWFQ